jgi:basic membrane lipoprotein Med (substrate-binding protein (PBP1-ABC) superfamily)/DNA-binding SARP family transcriptional activator
VLALLLLRANEIVPLERLTDDVWGDEPPASAAHALEAYISRLRSLLAPHGPKLVRSGPGYRLELAGADVDARRFEALLADADRAAGDDGRVARLTEAALALWRGPPLVDTPLSGAGRADVDRLAELHLHALELRFDAALAAGRQHELVGELRSLVEEHPFRERFLGQLMIALYRSGRHADALDVYEHARLGFLELGLRPSRELQELSGAIVRQEEALRLPLSAGAHPRASRRRLAAGTALVVVAATAVAVALAATRAADDPQPAVADAGTRVALLLPRAPVPGREDAFLSPFIDGFRRAELQYGLQTETLVGAEFSATKADNERLAAQVRQGDFDLVLLAAGRIGGNALLREVRRLPDTRFVFIDADLHETPYAGLRNVSSVRFADEQAGYLAGYLSGLVEARRSPRNGRRVISVVGGMKAIPSVRALVNGFALGARRALPSITVLEDYSGDFVRQAVCGRIANRQIDAGSDIVFAAAGDCGRGALAAAGIRGVFGIGVDRDYSYLGAHILASTIKRFDRAVIASVGSYVQGTLPPGGEVAVALDDDAVGLGGISPDVPASARRQLARVEAELRQRAP